MPGAEPHSASRYETLMKLASGGMATVWIGTVRGALGFRQLVAIKKPHPHLMNDPTFRAELIAEARLASMIHHANVVDVRDVEIDGDAISLVMDYIEGASLGDLILAASEVGTVVPPRVAVRIIIDALAGLHAAHELLDERGRAVGLVHRDVSPQNILVGLDGISRVADFGVAKFSQKNAQSTSEGSLKGKLAYMAPEYLRGENIDRRFDLFAVGVVLWETLAGERLFRRSNEAETLHALLNHDPRPICQMARGLGPALDPFLFKALSKNRNERFETAAQMAAALEKTASAAQLIAGTVEVADAVRALTGAAIEERRTLVRAKLANEPTVASMLSIPPEVVSRLNAASMEVTTDATNTTVMPLPPQPQSRGPARTLPLSSNVTPVSIPAPAPSASGSAEYVSDLSGLGLPRRRRPRWPLGIAAFLVIALVVGIAMQFRYSDAPAAAGGVASAASSAAPATESSNAFQIASATAVAIQPSVATTAPSSAPAAAAVRPSFGRTPTKPTSTSRRPPPNPYQDP